jgi:hypothetical protein
MSKVQKSSTRVLIEVDGNNIEELEDIIAKHNLSFTSFDLHIDLAEVSITELVNLWPAALEIISKYANVLDKENHSLHVIGPRASFISSDRMTQFLKDRVSCKVDCKLA